MEHVDAIVIGAGVVGLAVAAKLAQTGVEVVVLEQHELIGSEISARNSEVIHAGIYYPTGSRKAQLCVRGKNLLYKHCSEYQVPYNNCGKLIVASCSEQIPVVRGYIDKARDNGVVDLTWLNPAQVHELEPEVQAVGGVLSPSTGIVDSHAFMLSLQGILESNGGFVALQSRVLRIESAAGRISVATESMSLSCDFLVNAAGLHAPGLAAQVTESPKAYFAKGHYYGYSGQQPFARLVYPVAEAGGLGVHVTLDLAGQVKFGPDVRWIDQIDYSFDEGAFDDFVAAIRAYYPSLEPARLHPDYTGIRPKIAPADAGFRDFVIQGASDHGISGLVNLLGIESPGLTASLAIAEEVLDQLGLAP